MSSRFSISTRSALSNKPTARIHFKECFIDIQTYTMKLQRVFNSFTIILPIWSLWYSTWAQSQELNKAIGHLLWAGLSCTALLSATKNKILFFRPQNRLQQTANSLLKPSLRSLTCPAMKTWFWVNSQENDSRFILLSIKDAETETFHNRYLITGIFFPTGGKFTYTNNSSSPRWPLWGDKAKQNSQKQGNASIMTHLQAACFHFSPTQSHNVLSGSFVSTSFCYNLPGKFWLQIISWFKV